MILKNMNNRSKSGYTTFGCIWKKGQCTTNTRYILNSVDKKNLPLESSITAYYPDGSVKWSKHTVDASLLNEEIEVVPTDELCSDNNNQFNKVFETQECIEVIAKHLKVNITKYSKNIFDEVYIDNVLKIKNGKSVLILEEPREIDGLKGKVDKEYSSKILDCFVESNGELQTIIKFNGIHFNKYEDKIPFIIRMKIGYTSTKIDFTYTFIYDGDEEKDYLKGLGVTFEKPMKSQVYNRHIKMETDFGCFHETVVPLTSWRPKISLDKYESQMQGNIISFEGKEANDIEFVLDNTPYWSEYDLCQTHSNSFSIKKKLNGDNLCYINCLTGNRTNGTIAFGDENGSVILATRDFWQKYPSGYTVRNIEKDTAIATVWIWSPSADVMDFRHYANRGYNQVCYEGYDFKGATPYGIASTSEFAISFEENIIPKDNILINFSNEVNNPPVYIGQTEYYHDLKAFGYWSTVKKENELEIWLEKQLDSAVDFYIKEIEQRDWYGLFNYGDFMHTYDSVRNNWKYDIGGYAWDNTELVPTLWLWLMFMRTGREDIFTLAEKLSRHTSEVDVYHIGKYTGLGSRHNVIHWGCPCKEARIAMAYHHRYLYYLTGDFRLTDIFEELKDNEITFLNKDPLEAFYEKDKMKYPSHARTGPDWSALTSNWLTQWERFNDNMYKKKILIGIDDIKQAPLKLISGPDFEFDPFTNHLHYIGEKATGGTHLQICMGAPQTWLELSLLLEDEQWTDMLAQYGRFYFLDKQTQLDESNGIIGEREFSLPYMASAMGAFGAYYLKDDALAQKTWHILINELLLCGGKDGFKISTLDNQGNCEKLEIIPWVSTNFVAQWCLNVIMCLEFIRENLPKDLDIN